MNKMNHYHLLPPALGKCILVPKRKKKVRKTKIKLVQRKGWLSALGSLLLVSAQVTISGSWG